MTDWKKVPENSEVHEYINCYWFIEKTEYARNRNLTIDAYGNFE